MTYLNGKDTVKFIVTTTWEDVKKSRDFVDISLLAKNNVRKPMLDDTLG